jgi:hypothetical protein
MNYVVVEGHMCKDTRTIKEGVYGVTVASSRFDNKKKERVTDFYDAICFDSKYLEYKKGDKVQMFANIELHDTDTEYQPTPKFIAFKINMLFRKPKEEGTTPVVTTADIPF